MKTKNLETLRILIYDILLYHMSNTLVILQIKTELCDNKRLLEVHIK